MKLLPVLDSIKAIECLYSTGEQPIQVRCSDMNAYICKYMRSSASAYKLVCELMGAYMAAAWTLGIPNVALIYVRPSHWAGIDVPHVISAPTFGSKKMDGVVDITPSTSTDIISSADLVGQMLKIALFDFWIANEDRNANNANLLYDVNNEKIVPIDFGCIFNTATFEYPMSQLTMTDTILCSDLFKHLIKGYKKSTIENELQQLKRDYSHCVEKSKEQQSFIINSIPKEWRVSATIVIDKMRQLFDDKWTKNCWDNFEGCLIDNIYE